MEVIGYDAEGRVMRRVMPPSRQGPAVAFRRERALEKRIERVAHFLQGDLGQLLADVGDSGPTLDTLKDVLAGLNAAHFAICAASEFVEHDHG